MEEPLVRDNVDEDDASESMAELMDEMENLTLQNPPQSLSPNNKRFSEIQAEAFRDQDEINRRAEEASGAAALVRANLVDAQHSEVAA